MTCSWCPRTALYTEHKQFACKEHKSKLRPSIRHVEKPDAFRSSYSPFSQRLFRKEVK